MLNEDRIRIMTKLAKYQEGPESKNIEIYKYQKGDYIGLSLIKNFFLTSIGYLFLVGFVAAYFLEDFIDQIQNINVAILAAEVIIGYVVVLVVYTAITYIICSLRYEKAKTSVHEYYIELGRLERAYKSEKMKLDLSQAERRR